MPGELVRINCFTGAPGATHSHAVRPPFEREAADSVAPGRGTRIALRPPRVLEMPSPTHGAPSAERCIGGSLSLAGSRSDIGPAALAPL